MNVFLLSQSIEASALRHPDREAFRCGGASLDYAGLLDRADRLANTLRAAGVRRMDRVGIYLPKSLETAVAVYGILRAGAAYVPIDPSAPPDRVAFILADCGIEVLVTRPEKARAVAGLAGSAPGLRCVVGLDPPHDLPWETLSWAEVAAAPAAAPAPHGTEMDLAYIMYTSGSTGVPKGLMHTHRSGLAYARLAVETYGVRPGDRLGNHSPLHFDMSTFEYLAGPLAGATSVILPEEVTFFPQGVAHLIEAEVLTFWYSVPLALIQLLEQTDIGARDASALRWVLFGGEPFPPKHLRRLMRMWPQARFSNVYGPAEVNQCTFHHVPPIADGDDRPVPIGRVWANTDGLVLDEAGRPAAPGTAGELLVRSPTMMEGYWNRPDLNARAFHDVEAAPGFVHRYYRTGDLVEAAADGTLVFLGRKDRQVKVRGYRVELDEIESALAACPGVVEAAVFLVPKTEHEQAIVAAVLPGADGGASPGDLRTRIAATLPPYALPQHIVVRDGFPRTGSGKTDRRALQEAYRDLFA